MEDKFLTEKVARKILKKALGTPVGIHIDICTDGDGFISFYFDNKKDANRLLWALKILANKRKVKDENLLKN